MTQRFPSKRLPQWCCQSWSIVVLVLVAAVLMGHGTRLPAAAQDPMVTNRLGMTFVLIPAGDFMMGSPETEIDRGTSEIQHPVTISQPFYLQTTEVTVAQWRAVMGRRFFARKRGAGDMPVIKVSWKDCQKFIRKLSRMTGAHYGLPTEAQWEYAARAGSVTAYFWGDQIDCRRAMYANNPMKYDACVSVNRDRGWEPGCRAPVKQYPPNAWGLYDMHGNVWEWCADFFQRYSKASEVDPCKDDSGQDRVRRGGSWFSPGYACRSANRAYGHPMSRMQNTGFRVVMLPPVRPVRTDSPD
ncbi:conserved uncharacterized protein related to sulfatase modifying factor [Desulfosarcina variabilis str. Montpellier]|uniref:formylglycine-generating enzyme family protein n=1 Tax=Desulfosarcina variabilis TaxID=2300 RepID=UPI003AFB458D